MGEIWDRIMKNLNEKREEVKGPIPESKFPEFVDMVIKILIIENSRKRSWWFADDIRRRFDSYFSQPDIFDGTIQPIPANLFKLIRKDRGRPERKGAALEPYGKVRGQIWLN